MKEQLVGPAYQSHEKPPAKVDLELCETLADPLHPCIAIFNGDWVQVFRREPVFDRHADGVALFDSVGHNVHPQGAIR